MLCILMLLELSSMSQRSQSLNHLVRQNLKKIQQPVIHQSQNKNAMATLRRTAIINLMTWEIINLNLHCSCNRF